MRGKCYYCNKELNERTIKKHMKSCPEIKKAIERESQASKGSRNQLIISIKDKYNKNTYCIYVSIDENLQLAHLDKFIRNVWVECCGHLSCFKINGSSYNDNSDDLYQMNVKLKDVLSINQKFEYDYDFGSTTELTLEVVDRIKVPKNFSQIEIIARNNPIQHKCNECKKDAKYFNWQEEKYYCETCAQAFDEDELEEVGYTNSPRDGVCGYFGDEDNEKTYLPGNDKKYKIDNKNKPVTDDDLEGFWDFDDLENLDDYDELDDIHDFHGLYEDNILDNGVLEESVEKMIKAGMNEE